MHPVFQEVIFNKWGIIHLYLSWNLQNNSPDVSTFYATNDYHRMDSNYCFCQKKVDTQILKHTKGYVGIAVCRKTQKVNFTYHSYYDNFSDFF